MTSTMINIAPIAAPVLIVVGPAVGDGGVELEALVGAPADVLVRANIACTDYPRCVDSRRATFGCNHGSGAMVLSRRVKTRKIAHPHCRGAAPTGQIVQPGDCI
jgi:hypothetical protein